MSFSSTLRDIDNKDNNLYISKRLNVAFSCEAPSSLGVCKGEYGCKGGDWATSDDGESCAIEGGGGGGGKRRGGKCDNGSNCSSCSEL